MLQTVWNELDYRVDVCRIMKSKNRAPIMYATKTWSVVLLNKTTHILLSQVYCVWQVVKTPTIISNKPVCVCVCVYIYIYTYIYINIKHILKEKIKHVWWRKNVTFLNKNIQCFTLKTFQAPSCQTSTTQPMRTAAQATSKILCVSNIGLQLEREQVQDICCVQDQPWEVLVAANQFIIFCSYLGYT